MQIFNMLINKAVTFKWAVQAVTWLLFCEFTRRPV